MRKALFILALFVSASFGNSEFMYEKLGGKASVKAVGKSAFSKSKPNLNMDEEDLFILGKSFFKVPWVEAPAATTARDGLGPLFSANTCMTCHPKNGAGVAIKKNGTLNRTLLLRFSHKNIYDKTIGFKPDSTYGSQLSLNGNKDVPFEGEAVVSYTLIKGYYPDKTPYSLRKPTYKIEKLNYGALDSETIFAPRIGSALIGLGRLELISDEDILKHQDINDTDKDGISGKANLVYSPILNKTVIGKFTWKASASSVKVQSAAAASNDMSLTNPLFPRENCTKKQEACLKAPKGRFEFDLPQKRLDAISFYSSNLAVPNQREPKKHIEGAKLFKTLNCVSCHVDSYKTKEGDTIHPFSDLLLHDMGKDLADGRVEFLANGNEWRTAPLWGLGLRKTVSGEANYLHDGRALSVEEAILWHGGEALKSKEDFMKLEKDKRVKLLEFLDSI
jgi:CxxC motif-containing protein (DUF1111 family)